jgi:hypothetical protein
MFLVDHLLFFSDLTVNATGFQGSKSVYQVEVTIIIIKLIPVIRITSDTFAHVLIVTVVLKKVQSNIKRM